MRRQSKPFVTEYRSSGRRGKGSPGPQAGMDGRSSEPETQRVSWPPAEDDDGFAAAHAAADALFAGSGTTSSKRTSSSTQIGSSGDAGRGRILQAIEEPAQDGSPDPDGDRSALELTPPDTPKRRGRKPGTKRPATRINEPEQSEPLDDFGPAHTTAAETVHSPASEAPSAISTASVQVASPTFPVAATLAIRQRRRGERFSWVRTKLRPGERWKRRLPKVAW